MNLYHRFRFYVERLLAGGPFFQLLVVWCIVGVISVLGGILVLLIAREGSFTEELWWSFLRLSDPGYLGDDEGTGRRFISTILTVLGYVLFMGTLVAIMTQWLFRKMNRLEQGLTPVSYRGHTVILGWTSRTVPVLHELLTARFRKVSLRRIVVLADDITAGPMLQLAEEPLTARQKNRVILRSGSSINPEHLHRAGVLHADTVIVPGRSHSGEQMLSADSEVIKILTSLETQYRKLQRRPKVIAELQDARKIPIALHTYQGPMQVIASDRVIAKILTRCAVYPELAGGINALLVAEDQGQLVPIPATAFHGQAWQNVFAAFSQSTPCGVIRREGAKKHTVLAPEPDFLLDRHDEILVLAEGQGGLQAQPTTHVKDEPEATPLLLAPARPRKRSILILGWNNHVARVVATMQQEERTEFTITLVSTVPVEERMAILQDYLIETPERINRIECLQKDYTVEANVRALMPHQYDVIMLFSSHRAASGEEADARTIVGFMVLDYLLQSTPEQNAKRPHVLIELHDSSNTSYVQRAENAVIVSPVIVSHVLSQIARYPQLRSVYEELLSSEGARLSTRKAPDGLFGQRTVQELQQRAIQQGCVLLGIQRAGETRLNLPPTLRLDVDDSLLLIVLQRGLN
ncbi:hypothetical protein [Aliidiomarina sanyensis]|uniref:Ion channel DMI1 n=1 Tax=Aliidiomarina sanyensis TaxID=1249555 RepID=A0A432WAW8_9GAMM|nr:hypothetical protein [Aliidiomarina sanyensis]RUO27966.1 hypothetical protein CWE11_11045 [Aliidiomarina sanyensis]